ncbi:MAG: MobA/MobL family protein [Oscillospiraceae bacterium]|nr:MobA/MobL family protein [Oscillospiraceae bacterium]
MAIYHNHAKVITKASGRSPVAVSAYINGIKMTDEYTGKIHDYSKKREVMHREVMLPENAPWQFHDREILWNAVAKYEGQTGQKARTFEFSLPRELDLREQTKLLQNYVRDNFVNAGMCADFAIHDKKDGNPHAHINLTIRPIDSDGNWETKTTTFYVCKNKHGEERALTAAEWQADKATWYKKMPYYKDGKKSNSNLLYLTKHEADSDPKYKDYQRVKGVKKPEQHSEYTNPKIIEWSSPEFLENCREDLAVKINQALEENGFTDRVDHRSYEAQGIIKFPTKHLGVAAKGIEGKGVSSERGNENRLIEQANRDQLREIAVLEKEMNDAIIHIDELRRQQEQLAAVGGSLSMRPMVATLAEKIEQAKIRAAEQNKKPVRIHEPETPVGQGIVTEKRTAETYAKEIEKLAFYQTIRETKELAKLLTVIHKEDITCYRDFNQRLAGIKRDKWSVNSESENSKTIAGLLATVKKYKPIRATFESLNGRAAKKYAEQHKDELEIISMAENRLKELNADDNIKNANLDGAIACANEKVAIADKAITTLNARAVLVHSARNTVDKIMRKEREQEKERKPETER